jgi:DNA polymerase-1
LLIVQPAAAPEDAEVARPEQLSLLAGAGGEGEVVPGRQGLSVDPLQIASISDLERALPEILAAPAVGLDLETTGLDPFRSRIRLLQLAILGRTWVVDAFRVDPRALAPVLARARRLVGHNLKFELLHLWAAGVEPPSDLGRRLADTMVAARLLEAGIRGLHHGLGELAQRHLGLDLDKAEQRSDWSGELRSEQILYAARDAAVVLPLIEALDRRLRLADLGRVSAIEYAALPAVAWLEHTGAPLDGERWLRLAEAAEERRRRLEGELESLAPSLQPLLPLEGVEVEGRWNSPDELRRLLAERGIELADTREATLREHLGRDPLVAVVLEYREAAKLTGAFGKEFLQHLHPVTGRIHASWSQLGSDAGRMACHDPNLQQVPRDPAYRACFRAPEGRVLVTADYSQIELRAAAEIAGDRRLIDAFASGSDVHELTARAVLGRDQVSRADRQAAKAINFGLLYGMGAEGLRRYARAVYGVEMSELEAQRYRQRFFETYPGLAEWHRNQPDHPATTRTLAGRRVVDVAQFTAKLNLPVQGTATGDGLKLALGRIFETRQRAPGAVPVLAVHDEIVLEADAGQGEAVAAWLEDCMREGMRELLRRVPVAVQVRIGPDWSGGD